MADHSSYYFGMAAQLYAQASSAFLRRTKRKLRLRAYDYERAGHAARQAEQARQAAAWDAERAERSRRAAEWDARQGRRST